MNAQLIRACTWNVNHDSRAADVAATIGETVERGVDLWLLQEVKRRSGIVEWLRGEGLGVCYVEPEFAIAWRRDRFKYVRHSRVLMSPTRYWTLNYALKAKLWDIPAGRPLKVITYHPPAHVQAPRHVTFPRVSKVLREWDASLDRIGRRSRPRVLAGGDDNVDEHKGWHPQGGWGFLLDGRLTQVAAPRPTRGGRRIDDFRTNLRPVGDGWVLEPRHRKQDHRPFVHDFAYN